MSESTFGEIHRAFLDHRIPLFRDQKITRERHIDFSRRFGELDRHDSLPPDRHPEYPELLMVTNPKPDGKPGDGKYTERRIMYEDDRYLRDPLMRSLRGHRCKRTQQGIN